MANPNTNMAPALQNPLPYGAPFQGARRYPLYPAGEGPVQGGTAQSLTSPLPWASGEEVEVSFNASPPIIH